jgi:hypothetical protein
VHICPYAAVRLKPVRGYHSTVCRHPGRAVPRSHPGLA